MGTIVKTENLVILQGKTLSQIVLWETSPIVYKPITAITQGAPVRITSAGHGVPDGWNVAIVSVKGMKQINALTTPPKERDYYPATKVDANSIELNDVNSSDYSAYTSGGYIQYNTPASLVGYSARMSIKDKVGGTELLSLTTVNNRIVLDSANFTIKLTLSATETAALTWTKGVYDLEMVSASGVVTAILTGAITVTKEVTT